MIENIVSNISNYLYTYILIILLVGGGLYFSIRTKFVQFRLFGEQLRAVTEQPDDKKGVSSFQALMVSTASRVERAILSVYQQHCASAVLDQCSGCGL